MRQIIRFLVLENQRFRHFAAAESGAAIVLAAVLFPAIIGGIGLGSEAGYWYLKQRQLQHAADLSAHAAGTRMRSGDSDATLRAIARRIAGKAGYTPGANELVLHTPPLDGAYANNEDAVEVQLTRQLPRMFSGIFTSEPVALRAEAVALIRDGNEACVLALSGDASPGIKLSGSSLVELSGCDLASNSLAADSVLMNGGSASLSAGCVYSVGEIVDTNRLTLTECDAVKEYASVTRDPYASVAEPANIGAIPASMQTRGEFTPTYDYGNGIMAMRFAGGWSPSGAVTLNPGLYIVDGGTLSVNGGGTTITGAGVTIFLANGATAQLTGNAGLDLSPPTSGPYSGLTFFGSRSGTSLTHQVNGTSGSVVEGAVYFPESHIRFSGNSRTSGGGGCTQVVGNTVELTGNSSLRSTCQASGTRDVLANRFVRLVE